MWLRARGCCTSGQRGSSLLQAFAQRDFRTRMTGKRHYEWGKGKIFCFFLTQQTDAVQFTSSRIRVFYLSSHCPLHLANHTKFRSRWCSRSGFHPIIFSCCLQDTVPTAALHRLHFLFSRRERQEMAVLKHTQTRRLSASTTYLTNDRDDTKCERCLGTPLCKGRVTLRAQDVCRSSRSCCCSTGGRAYSFGSLSPLLWPRILCGRSSICFLFHFFICSPGVTFSISPLFRVPPPPTLSLPRQFRSLLFPLFDLRPLSFVFFETVRLFLPVIRFKFFSVFLFLPRAYFLVYHT